MGSARRKRSFHFPYDILHFTFVIVDGVWFRQ